ncbi:hypothetical protein D1AOALGA4SA_11523 [Olavius algarvensis Delta 1 endosymbiont]|nr:hypothetical protein D1AOALGA4SA_11523 [Olavius algarvensis Delta 1 endosymbiont]
MQPLDHQTVILDVHLNGTVVEYIATDRNPWSFDRSEVRYF